MSNIQAKITDPNSSCIIGEISQNHDGSLGMCHAYIDALADAGVDAVKFQTHIAAEESTIDEQFRVRFSFQDATRYDYWRRMEFTEPQWLELKNHAESRNIGFLSTPFSVAAVQLLTRIGIQAWKVGSGDTMTSEIIRTILETKKPIIVSTGMSTWAEIDATVNRLRTNQSGVALMQCTSKYPTPLTDVGLNNLIELKNRYGYRVGLSDHSGSTSPSLAAIARGFNLIEIHATFDRRMFGPDVRASLTIEEIASITRFAADLRTMDTYPVNKDAMSAELERNKILFGRSVALNRNLPSGHILEEKDLAPKKPGNGIQWSDKGQLVGKVLRRDVPSNRLLRIEDLE
jgi:N,N'-diacetyllegionaminate synthase